MKKKFEKLFLNISKPVHQSTYKMSMAYNFVSSHLTSGKNKLECFVNSKYRHPSEMLEAFHKAPRKYFTKRAQLKTL